jgi:hypothetical protein
VEPATEGSVAVESSFLSAAATALLHFHDGELRAEGEIRGALARAGVEFCREASVHDQYPAIACFSEFSEVFSQPFANGPARFAA